MGPTPLQKKTPKFTLSSKLMNSYLALTDPNPIMQNLILSEPHFRH